MQIEFVVCEQPIKSKADKSVSDIFRAFASNASLSLTTNFNVS